MSSKVTELYDTLRQLDIEKLVEAHNQILDTLPFWETDPEYYVYAMSEINSILSGYCPEEILRMVRPDFSVEDRWFFVGEGQLHSFDRIGESPVNVYEMAEWFVEDLEENGEEGEGKKILKDLGIS